VFASNQSPFNGAAISVSLGFAINGTITSTKLEDNHATFGGAIFYCCPLGSLTVVKSWFERNAADAGSHMYLRNITFYSNDTRWIVSTGTRSGIEAVSVTNFTLEHANFFRNGHGINFISPVGDIHIKSSCFLNYDDTPGYPENMWVFRGEGNISFVDTWVNKRHLNESDRGGVDEVEELLSNKTSTETDAAEACRLIPTPSKTTDVRLDFDAWFSIISIGFFVVVSVLGILMVTCCHSVPQGQPLLDHSDVDRELDDIAR
jgi:hypothetical protein